MSGRTRASQHQNAGQSIQIDRSIMRPVDAVGGSGWGAANGRTAAVRPWEPGMLWTRSRMIGNSGGGEPLAVPVADWWETMPEEGGTQSMPAIRGFALDSVGDPIEGATIQGFVTATDLHVGRETTSKVDGSYELRTTYVGQQHYVVAYKTGSPTVAGTTVNTLTPSD